MWRVKDAARYRLNAGARQRYEGSERGETLS